MSSSDSDHIVSAGIQTDLFDHDITPENACVNYGDCNNVVPGNGTMCGDCLTAARKRDRERYDG